MGEWEKRLHAWLRNHLLPRLASIFGVEPGCLEKTECSIARPSDSFFLSDLFFARIRFPGEAERYLVVKLPAQSELSRSYQNYDQLFANEILFYDKLARTSRHFARCYWGALNDLCHSLRRAPCRLGSFAKYDYK